MVSFVVFNVLFLLRSNVRYFASRSRITMMPEGPECKSLSENLDLLIGSSRFVLNDVEIVSGRYSEKQPENLDKVTSLMGNPKDAVLQSVKNKGKFIYFSFPSFTIWSTLGLTGGWTPKLNPRHSRVRLLFSPTMENSSRKKELITPISFYDMRNFGTLKFCLNLSELDAKLDSLGFDWLDEFSQPTLSDFLALSKQAARYKRPLAVFLMDQKKTSGIGNYILSEVLFKTSIHPNATCEALNQEAWEDLYHAIKSTIQESYASQSPYATAAYKEFSFSIYAQKFTPSGAVVVRSVGTHKRTVHWDPNVQTRFAPSTIASAGTQVE